MLACFNSLLFALIYDILIFHTKDIIVAVIMGVITTTTTTSSSSTTIIILIYALPQKLGWVDVLRLFWETEPIAYVGTVHVCVHTTKQ